MIRKIIGIGRINQDSYTDPAEEGVFDGKYKYITYLWEFA